MRSGLRIQGLDGTKFQVVIWIRRGCAPDHLAGLGNVRPAAHGRSDVIAYGASVSRWDEMLLPRLKNGSGLGSRR